MAKIIRQLWQRILLLFWAAPPVAPAVVLEPPPVAEPLQPESKARIATSVGREVEETGTFYYLGDILANLDEYFSYLSEMKLRHKQAFALYSKTGGQVITDSFLAHGSEFEPFVREHLPSFFMFHAYRDYEDTADTICPKLLFFQKLKNPAFVERAHGVIYECCCYYEHAKRCAEKKPLKAFGTFHVTITGNEVRLLKEYGVRRQQLKRGRNRGVVIKHHEFCYPALLNELAERHKTTPAVVAEMFFRTGLNCSTTAQGGFRVSVSKGGMNAVFNIDLLRTPYFFKDRDLVVNENGRRKRIFHIVRTHERTTGGDGKVFVKSHFRGMREFNWHDYHVLITMPGKHHALLNEFTAAALEQDEDAPIPANTVDMGELGSRIAAHIAGKAMQ